MLWFGLLWMALNSLFFFLEIILVLVFIRWARIKVEIWRLVIFVLSIPIIKIGVLFTLKQFPYDWYPNMYVGLGLMLLLTCAVVSLVGRFLLPLRWKHAAMLLGWLLVTMAVLSLVTGLLNNMIAPQGGVLLNVS